MKTSGRKATKTAVAVDPDAKSKNLLRLARIEGQVRGLAKMVEEDRYCADVMTQISSVQQALRAVSKELMRNHLRHCAHHAMQGGAAEREAMVEELLELTYRNTK